MRTGVFASFLAEFILTWAKSGSQCCEDLCQIITGSTTVSSSFFQGAPQVYYGGLVIPGIGLHHIHKLPHKNFYTPNFIILVSLERC